MAVSLQTTNVLRERIEPLAIEAPGVIDEKR